MEFCKGVFRTLSRVTYDLENKIPWFFQGFLDQFWPNFLTFFGKLCHITDFQGVSNFEWTFRSIKQNNIRTRACNNGGLMGMPPSPLHFLVNYGGRQYFSVFRGPFTLKFITLALRTIQFKKHIAEKHSWPISGQCSPFIATEGIRKQVFCFQGELKKYTDLKWFNCIFSVIWIYHILKYIYGAVTLIAKENTKS